MQSDGPDECMHPCGLIMTFSVCRHIKQYAYTYSVSGHRRPRSACTHAQFDQGLCSSNCIGPFSVHCASIFNYLTSPPHKSGLVPADLL